MGKDFFISMLASAIVVGLIFGLGCFIVWEKPSDFVVRIGVATWVIISFMMLEPKKW